MFSINIDIFLIEISDTLWKSSCINVVAVVFKDETNINRIVV